MEDFSSILWVVIIVAAMIFNSVSKARKSRNNDGQPSPQHGEAWPSIPWDNEGETAAEKRAEGEIATAGQSPQRPTGSVGQPVPEHRTDRRGAAAVEADAEAKRAATTDRPVFTAFPDEFQPQEPTPAQTSETGYKRTKTAIPGISKEEIGAGGPAERRVGAKKSDPDASRVRISPAEEPEAAEIAEEFDLRRAVIYSEILKPKFEE